MPESPKTYASVTGTGKRDSTSVLGKGGKDRRGSRYKGGKGV